MCTLTSGQIGIMRIREFFKLTTQVSALALVSTLALPVNSAVSLSNIKGIPAPNPARQAELPTLTNLSASHFTGTPRAKPGSTRSRFAKPTALASYAPQTKPNALKTSVRASGNPQQATVAAARSYPQQQLAAPATGSVEPLKIVLEHVKDGRLSEALTARNALPDNLDRRIADWFITLKGGEETPITHIAQFAASAPHWPTAKIVRARGEVSLASSNLSPQQIIGAFGGTLPETTDGKIALAKAHLATGNKAKALQLISPLWQSTVLEEEQEQELRALLGNQLNQRDHRLRAEMLLYKSRTSAALRQLPYLSKDEQTYIKARVASIKRTKNATKLLSRMPLSMQNDPNHLFARIRYARLNGNYPLAAKLLDAAPTQANDLLNRDEWWIQRRDVSRELIEERQYRRAYTMAANHAAESPKMIAEAEFQAGWFALRYVQDAKLAEPHFKRLAELGTTARTLSRAYYWLGRTREALQDNGSAIAYYQQAGAFQTSYYGQLALAKLGIQQLPLAELPQISAADRAAFDRNELVQAIRRMEQAGLHNDTLLFYTHLSRTLQSNGQLRLLTELAEANGVYQWSTMVGRLAQAKRPEAAPLAYPTRAIPAKTRIKQGVEKPMVYAIARQESSFNPKARSSAGALGLLQLMPATARETAKNIGLRYSKSKLTSDPAYNATLGAAHLQELGQRV